MKHSPARRILIIVGVLLWLLAVLPAYYVVHKPFGGEPFSVPPTISPNVQNIVWAVLGLLVDLGLLGLTLLVAAGWGSRIGRWLGITYESGLERWSLGVTLGLGLLGSVVFVLGLAGGLHRWVGYLVLLALGLSALPEIRALLRWLASGLRRVRPGGIPWLWLYIGFIGLLTLGLALLPPTGWDALVYHLQGPRLYLEAHRLIAVLENFYLNWPAQVEMLFTWGMLLKGDTLAKLLHWVFWPITAALLYALARRTVNPRAGRWAVALWASVPFAAELAGVAYVDLSLTAFVLAGVYAFLHWTESESNSWLALSAVFIGLAMATKYTAVTWLGLLLLLLTYHAWRHQHHSLGWILVRAAGFAAIAGLIVMPWLAKNWFVTGNPVYPFLFGGTGWNPTREAWLTWPGQGYSQNPLDYLALPWLMTVLGTTGTAAFDATVGPLLLILVPLSFLARGRPRAVNYGLVLVAGQFLYFAVTVSRYIYLTETRLLLPAFPYLCLAAAFALQRLPIWDHRAFRLSWVVGVMVALVMVLNLLTEAQAFLKVRPLAPLAGFESREAFLSRQLGYHMPAMRYTDDHLPAQSRTFFLWEPRAYYAKTSAFADATLDNLAQLRVTYQDTEEVLKALRAKGFTHLLYFRAGLEFLLAPTPRPPTLSSLAGPPEPGASLYPLTDADRLFLEELLGRCQSGEDVGGIYEFCRLP